MSTKRRRPILLVRRTHFLYRSATSSRRWLAICRRRDARGAVRWLAIYPRLDSITVERRIRMAEVRYIEVKEDS